MVIVKKYSNRRLYDTDLSRYVTLEELAEHFEKGVRGEVTIVVEGVRNLARKTLEDESSEDLEALDQEIRALFEQGYSCKEITAQLAPELGVAKREIYARALALKEAK